MHRSLSIILVVALVVTLAASVAFAGAKIKINDESSIDFGFRVQSLMLMTQKDVDGDGTFDDYVDFKDRRARLRVKGVINKWAECFIQTDISEASGGSGRDMRVIDAYVNLMAHPWANFYTGINMVPSSRQNLTSSGAMMAIDRPGLNYKTLSWGTRSLSAFNNTTIGVTDSGIRGEEDVRDAGVTVFGAGNLTEKVHAKYYAGVYDGIQMAGKTEKRFAGRVQFNLFDAEGGYYNSSTYLGKKKTLGVGASIDVQNAVAADTLGNPVDYVLFSGDAFAEFPVAELPVTLEAGVYVLDYGDAIKGPAATPKDLLAVQGTGFYAEGGVLLAKRWQPWGEFELWSSDDPGDVGSYNLFRAGVNYYLAGQNANIKAGFERMKSDVLLTSTEDTIYSWVLGAFITY